MATDNGGSLSFEVKLMLDKLQADVKKANAELAKIGKTATDEGKKIDSAFSGIGKSVASIGAAFSAQQLARQIIQVRGEFEKLEVSFNTMLRSEEKATALMNQLTKTAATTPFGLQDVAGGAKQLLAYGMEAEKINETLIRLGDIAAGLNIPLQDMTYLFGTTMVQGRMYTQDLNQFVGRGIPLIKEFANQFGVAESKVKDLVTEGKIGFPQLQKAIIAMTSEGGQFAGLMEAQSKTIAGQIANLQDSIDMMFNEIGQASEGIISGSIEVVASLVENYEQVGRVLLSLVGVYGVYKTAVIAMTAVYTAQAAGIGALTLAEKLHYTWLVLVEKAQKILNATMLTNPYVLVATAVAGLVAYLVSLKTETELIAEANEKYEESKRKQIEAEEEHMRKVNELITIAGDEALSTDTRRNALVKLEMQYPSIFAQYDTEYEKLKNIKKIKEEIAKLEAGKSIQNVENELDKVEARIKELEAKAKTKHLVGYDARDMAIYEGGLSAQERNELKVLKEREKELVKINKQKERERVLTNLSAFGEKTLNNELKARKDLLAKMKMDGSTRGRIKGGILPGDYTIEELEKSISAMEHEIKRRNDPQKTAAEWKKYYQDQYEAKRKAYNDFLKKQGTMTQLEFETEAKRLKDEMDAAKKEVDNYKPAVNRGATQQTQQEAERRLKLQQDLADDLLKMQQDNEQREIDAKDEGTAKRLAQINHDFEVRRKEIEKQEKEWKKQNIEAGVTTEENGLTKEQSDALADAYAQNAEARKKAEREVYDDLENQMNEYLSKYGDYLEKKQALTDIANQKAKEAATQGERAVIYAELREQLKQLNFEEFLSSDAALAFGDIDNLSRETIDRLIKKMREIRPEIIKTFNPEQIAKFDNALNNLEKADALNKNNILVNFIPEVFQKQILLQTELNSAKERYNSLTEEQIRKEEEVKDQIKLIEDEYERLTGEKIKFDPANFSEFEKQLNTLYLNNPNAEQSIQPLIDQYFNLDFQLQDITTAAQDASGAMESLGGAGAGAAGGAAQTIAMVGTIVHAINDSVQSAKALIDDLASTADALGADTEVGSGWDTAQTFMSAFAEASQGATDAFEAFKSGNPIGVIQGVVKSFTAWIRGFAAIHDAKKERDILDIQEQIEDLTKAYDDLDRAIDKVYSTDAAKMIEEQNRMLEEQQRLIREQMQLEEDKKNTDEERLEQWEDELHDIDNQIADNKEAAVDAIYGEDIQSAIENFADAYVGVWSDGSVKIKDVVRQMMQNMVKESIKASIDSSKAMEEIRKTMQILYADGVLSQADQNIVYDLAEKLQKDLDAEYGWSESLFKNMTEQSGSSRGFEAMSQDTADELNGRFTTMVELQSLQLDKVNALALDTASIRQNMAEMRNLSLLSIGHLESLVKSNNELYQINARLGRIEEYTSRL